MKNVNRHSLSNILRPPSRWRQVRGILAQHHGAPYEVIRESLRVLIPYEWRRAAVHFARRRFGLHSIRDYWKKPPRPEAILERRSAPHTPGDFFESIRLLPHLDAEMVDDILQEPIGDSRRPRPDIFCFSIIDWTFRFQRPQQLMLQFAAHGHRVFYLNISEFLSPNAIPKFSLQPVQLAQPMPGIKNNLFEVRLAMRYPLDLFDQGLGERDVESVIGSIEELRRAENINDAIGYVMMPSWGAVARAAQSRWGWKIVYDCMDEWENFPRVKPEALALEKQLVDECDLLVVTAARLQEKWNALGRNSVLARNAVDYDFYERNCVPNDLLADTPHPIVGFYGAIADWFDVRLMAEIAQARPAYTFILLGGIFDVDVTPLRNLRNVKLLGQQPYETMPKYLHHFDACIIPFKVNSITEATDPVKMYEYLSGGKPVVSIRLPELDPYREHIYLADNGTEFIAQLDRAISETAPETIQTRKALAKQHTWANRYRQIDRALTEITPGASIVIVTYNNLALTQLCLESLLRNTEYANYEIIVVDNDSRDDTPHFLEQIAARENRIRILLNRHNYGFARANNQGIDLTSGEHLVLLNNDTVVPPGWLTRLLRHLGDPAVGIVGPVTNFVGNEARVQPGYQSWIEMERFAQRHTWEHDNLIADIHMLAMFCVAMRREIYERVGPLDEQFGIGMFEDDDYSLRVRQAGLRVICAADVFVHHFGQAAFGKLIESGHYDGLFNENRQKYETKWNTVWTPHQNRDLEFTSHVFEDGRNQIK
jgi:GT2 family glycosyltransferase